MEKVKIYLSDEESKNYDDSNSIFEVINFSLEHFHKIKDLINLKKFEISEVEYINEDSGFYSILLTLKEKNIECQEVEISQ